MFVPKTMRRSILILLVAFSIAGAGFLMFGDSGRVIRAELRRLTTEAERHGWGYGRCYPLLENLGKKAVRKLGDLNTALSLMEKRFCSSAYLHGAAGQFASQTDNETAILRVCEEYGKKGEWELRHCVQGLGRGIIGRLPDGGAKPALEICSAFPSEVLRSECAIGVYEEFFRMLPFERLPFCAGQNRFKKECYAVAGASYVSEAIRNDDRDVFGKALVWCSGAETSYLSNCVFAAAHRVSEENPTDYSLAANLCAAETSGTLLATCIEGGIGGIAGFYAGPEKAREACAALREEHKTYCPPNLRQ